MNLHVNFIFIVLKGFSQVLFLENTLMGILIIAGLSISSPIALILALVGNITGTATALLFGMEKNVIEMGRFGFNGVLIGIVTSLYIKQLPVNLVITIVASIGAAILFYILLRNNIQPFSAPFVLLAWAIIIVVKLLKLS